MTSSSSVCQVLYPNPIVYEYVGPVGRPLYRGRVKHFFQGLGETAGKRHLSRSRELSPRCRINAENIYI